MKLDSLGRANNGFKHLTKEQRGKNSAANGKKRKKIYETLSVRIDSPTLNELRKRGRMSQKIREYIEWGLENEDVS